MIDSQQSIIPTEDGKLVVCETIVSYVRSIKMFIHCKKTVCFSIFNCGFKRVMSCVWHSTLNPATKKTQCVMRFIHSSDTYIMCVYSIEVRCYCANNGTLSVCHWCPVLWALTGSFFWHWCGFFSSGWHMSGWTKHGESAQSMHTMRPNERAERSLRLTGSASNIC